MGAGHVKFFYDKLMFLYKRQVEIVHEMHRRGFKPKYDPETLKEFQLLKPILWNDWEPTEDAIKINQQRIDERLGII
jgi:deoxyribonuclease (pyrimidine dimer)